MSPVYRLRDDQFRIDAVQKATLTTTEYGIEPTHGLFGSDGFHGAAKEVQVLFLEDLRRGLDRLIFGGGRILHEERVLRPRLESAFDLLAIEGPAHHRPLKALPRGPDGSPKPRLAARYESMPCHPSITCGPLAPMPRRQRPPERAWWIARSWRAWRACARQVGQCPHPA